MDENGTIQALEAHLATHEYVFESRCHTTQRGTDLVMTGPGKRIVIEAKGNTSSREGSKRFKKPFTDSQCADHFSRAFYTACKMRDAVEDKDKGTVRVAIGLGYSEFYAKYERWSSYRF